MKVKEIMYAATATRQYTYKFNEEYNTNIEVSSEVIDGSPFVYIDFDNTPPELIFKYSFQLGGIQEYLSINRKRILPIEDYPLPSEEK